MVMSSKLKNRTVRYTGCLPFTRANRSVYRLGWFGQMVSKFPYWENSVRDWGPFLETPGNFSGPKIILGTQYSPIAIQFLLILKAKF